MKALLKKSAASEPFTFSFVDDGGRMIVKSENYGAKKSAENGIESVRKNSQDDSRYEMLDSKNGKFYFNIKASNGQIVATSAMFDSDADRAAAASMLKSGAPAAQLDDQTG
ncbi:MAG: YegP family protein [Chromatiales bacterium]|jgi:uncharacterized protein YegP (UPF0339 family)